MSMGDVIWIVLGVMYGPALVLAIASVGLYLFAKVYFR